MARRATANHLRIPELAQHQPPYPWQRALPAAAVDQRIHAREWAREKTASLSDGIGQKGILILLLERFGFLFPPVKPRQPAATPTPRRKARQPSPEPVPGQGAHDDADDTCHSVHKHKKK